jgi:hypothetical protein
MSEPDMIEPVVHEKRRNARKKTRLMWSWRFGPIPELHGAVSPQKPGRASGLSWPLFGQPSWKQP